jgi:hypothetical protein
MDELRAALRSSPSGRKATGPDNIRGDIIRQAAVYPNPTPAAPLLLEAALDLANHVLKTAEVPIAWRRNEIIAIPKVKAPTSAGDARGITLVSHVSKIFSALHVFQCGFRPRRGTMHALACLQQLVQLHRRARRPLFVVFIDCSKAFDSVNRRLLIEALRAHGVGPNLLKAIEALYAPGDENYLCGCDRALGSTAGVKLQRGRQLREVDGQTSRHAVRDVVFCRYPTDKKILALCSASTSRNVADVTAAKVRWTSAGSLSAAAVAVLLSDSKMAELLAKRATTCLQCFSS